MYRWNEIRLREVFGVATVGGLRAESLSRIAGVLCAYTESVRRDHAILTVPAETLRRWGSEQAKLIAGSRLPPSAKLRAASIVLQCGGTIDGLPIAVRGGDYLSYDDVTRLLSNEEEIIVLTKKEVMYDEDSDGCQPKDFETSFEPEERLFFVCSPGFSVFGSGDREPPRDFLQLLAPTSPSSLPGLFKIAIIEKWGPDYDVFDEERPVGEVDEYKILRDVTAYRWSG